MVAALAGAGIVIVFGPHGSSNCGGKHDRGPPEPILPRSSSAGRGYPFGVRR